MKPNPFGNQGFESLKFLMDKRQANPFPPVIIFTKWEKFLHQWDDKKFVRKEAKGQTSNQVARRLLEMVCSKLREADIKDAPFVAAVNAVDALEPEDDTDDIDEEERSAIRKAKGE